MNTIQCFEPECQNEGDYYCNCSSSVTHFCKFHYADHCMSSSSGSHTLNSLFLKPIERTKKAVLELLEDEIYETLRMKAQILDSFNRILNYYKIVLKDLVKEIDFKLEKVKSHYEKVLEAQRISRFESDEVLNLLVLQPYEIAQNFKANFTTNLNDIAKLFYKMNRQIYKIIKSFNNDKLQNDGADLSIYDNLYQKIGAIIYEEKKYEKAIKYRINPNREIYLCIKGAILEELSRKDEAIKCYNQALEVDPNSSDACNAIGFSFKNEKRYEESLKYFNDAIRINSNNANYYKNKGDALLWLEQIREANESYNIAIRKDPNNADIYNDIGNEFYQIDQEEAIAYYNESIRINPRKADYYINKFNALFCLDRIEDAKNCYNEAIRINPNNADICYQIGNRFFERNEEEALKYYNDAIKINPNKASYYINKGCALLTLERIKEANECYNEAIKTNPNNGNIYNYIGKNFYWVHKNEEALKYHNDAIRINPCKAGYYKNKGDALLGLERIEEAKECYSEVIKINPNDGDIYCKIGEQFLWIDEGESIKYYNHAIKINPSKADYYINKGKALLSWRRTEEAKECFNKAIEKDPNNDDILNEIEDEFIWINKKEAIKYYKDAHRVILEKADALDLLGRFKEADKYLKKAELLEKSEILK